MQVALGFTVKNKARTCPVPTGKLVIVRVPGHGLQGYHKPNEGRSQVFVPTGKVKTVAEAEAALIEAWLSFVGIDMGLASV